MNTSKIVVQKVDKQPSPLAAAFEQAWRALGGPELVCEYRFHPKRRWLADYAHVESRVMIELEGGVYGRGRHVRPKGFIDDCAKYNAATMMDWAVLRIPTGGVQPDSLEAMMEFIYRRLPLDK